MTPTLRRSLRLTSVRVALVAALIAGGVLAFVPLFNVLGVESALALGLVLPPFVAVASARYVVALRRDRLGRTPWAAIGAGAMIAAMVVLVPIGLLALNGLRVTQCAPGESLAFILLGPASGCVLAGITGVAVSGLVPRPTLAAVMSGLLPIIGIGIGVYRFWATPAIFAYSHFVGYFPGTLYDVDIDVPDPLVSFRAVSAVIALGLACVFAAFIHPPDWCLSWPSSKRRKLLALVALLAFGAAVTAEAMGPELGHRTTSAHLAEELGGRMWGERCIIYGPREMEGDDYRRLLSECEFRIGQAEAALGVRQPVPIRVFLFRHADEKRRLMGAGRTYIAKPWRNEVYLQARSHPHPVLFHELVHVVAANFGRGPFRISGSLGGILPSPGLIEGVATAVAWVDDEDELTTHQWSRAMLELGMLPRLDQVVGLAFVTQQKGQAYKAAGSFLRYVLDTYGPREVREAYRAGGVRAIEGKPLEALEAEWHRYLRTIALPGEAKALARAQFEGGSIFETTCPHELEDLGGELHQDIAAGDHRRALKTVEEILDIEPNHTSTLTTLAGVFARAGLSEDAETTIDLLKGLDAPQPFIAAARESVADAMLGRGEIVEARQLYRALLSEPQSLAARRSLEVKLAAVNDTAGIARLVGQLLLGPHGAGGTPSAVIVHLARALESARPDGLGPYLEARQMVGYGRYDLAVPLLRDARARGLPSPALTYENARLLGASLAYTGELSQARDIFEGLRTRGILDAAQRDVVADWLARLVFLEKRAASELASGTSG